MNPKKSRGVPRKPKDPEPPSRPVAVRLGREDLLGRLYDTGFSHYPLPSVKRPQTKNSHSKPLTCKQQSLSNTLIQAKKQKQSSILFNVPEQSYLTPAQEDLYKSQHSAFMYTHSRKFYSKPKTGQPRSEHPNARQRTQEQDEDLPLKEGSGALPAMARTTYGAGFRKNRKERLTTPVAGMAEGSGFQTGNQFYSKPQFPAEVKKSVQTAGNFYHAGQELTITPDNRREFVNSKRIIDIYRGKKDDIKPEEGEDSSIAQLEANFRKNVLGESDEEEDHEQSESSTLEKKESTEQEDKVAVQLDAYIKLVLKNSSSVDEFVYLTPTPGSTNPYKLSLCDFQKLSAREAPKPAKGAEGKGQRGARPSGRKMRSTPIQEHYTISGKGLCHYKNGKPVEFIKLTNWMKERDTFKQIQSLKFFQKFRKWKTLKMWRKVLQTYKRTEYTKSLAEKLFISQPFLKTALFKHRALCYDMSKEKFINLKTQAEGTSEIIDLDKFSQNQQEKRNAVQEAIKEYSQECRRIVNEGFDGSMRELHKGSKLGQQTENVIRHEKKNYHKIKDIAYENLSFNTSMSYDQRSQIRQTCIQFLRFSFLIDFLTLHSLSTIFMNSVNELEYEITRLSLVEKDTIVIDPEQAKNTFGREIPMFTVNIDFMQDQPLGPETIMEVEIDKFEMPEDLDNVKDYEDFNLLGHPYLIEKKGSSEFPRPPDAVIHSNEQIPTQFYQKKVNNLHSIWQNLKPNLKTFQQEVDTIFTEGISYLKSFKRWSHHNDMEKYSNILEEWDDQIGDSSEGEGNQYLNPEVWVSDYCKTTCKQNIKDKIVASFTKATNHLQVFKPYLQTYWEYKKLRSDIILSEFLNDTRLIFKSIFMVNQFHEQHFETHIPIQADLGLLRISSEQLKEQIKPMPHTVIERLKDDVPEEMKRRLRHLTDWIKESMVRLNHSDKDDVKSFVTLKENCNDIETRFPHIKRRIRMVEQLSQIAIEFNIDLHKKEREIQKKLEMQGLPVPKDTQPTLQELQNMSKDLNKEIMQRNNEITNNTDRIQTMIEEERVKQLRSDVGKLSEKCDDPRYLAPDSDTDEMISELEENWRLLVKYRRQGEELNEFEEKLDMERTDFDQTKKLENSLNSKLTLWRGLKEWAHLEELEKPLKLSEVKTTANLQRTEAAGKVIKVCRSRIPPDTKKLIELENIIRRYERTQKLVQSLLNPDVAEDEKTRSGISEVLEVDERDYGNMTVQRLYDVEAFEKVKVLEVAKLSTRVTKVKELLEDFEKNVEQPYAEFTFKLKTYDNNSAAANNNAYYVLVGMRELTEDMDKLFTKVSNIATNRFLGTHKFKVNRQKGRIRQAVTFIDEWIKFQNQWVYLEKIFGAKEFKNDLVEAKEFDNISKAYRKMAKHVSTAPNIKLMDPEQKWIKKNVELLKGFNEQLKQITKSLNNFLDSKREILPRLHFVSNEEMVLILARQHNRMEVQKYIGNLFENVRELIFFEEEENITGFRSREGEELYFESKGGNRKSVSIQEGIDNWLRDIGLNMEEALGVLIKSGFKELVEFDSDDRRQKAEWYKTKLSQVVAVAHQFYWTMSTEINLKDEDPKMIYESIIEIENNMKMFSEIMKEGLKGYRHKIIVSTITQEVNNRDITIQLIEEGVHSPQEFLWQQQLRYDRDPQNGRLLVRQINACFDYGYEYIGPTSRIVVTPLTARCWITITSALNLGLGAAPAGPAGTGKTESTKDLAKSMGRFCIVFNCSEQIRYQIMQRFFKGILIQGAWMCLDEFNRIDIEVLSVIAQQLLDMHLAMVNFENTNQMDFDGNITFSRFCGVFITMNPGYAGRTELPDNLKVLFRPVAMMIPDYALIARILLLSEGFTNSESFSSKMRDIYKLASEQLSQQKHYDFGLRALKSVLVMAGKIKRLNPDGDENVLLIQAIRDSNLPKFLAEDLILFEGLVDDLFKVKTENYINEKLNSAVSLYLQQEGLEHEGIEPFKHKVQQLYGTLNVRLGVVVIGAGMTGKSLCIRALKGALTMLKKKEGEDALDNAVEAVFMNPKSVTMGQLYGEEHPTTKDWHGGLASHYIIDATKNPKPGIINWIVFDGPVDAIWIENMNSVLDDSRILCLANGQRIRLGENIKILFEVGDLDQASPATVSRLGVVFMAADDIGWRPLVHTWFRKHVEQWRVDPLDEYSSQVLEQETIDRFRDNVFKYVEEMLKYTVNCKKEPVGTLPIQRVRSVCDYLQIYLSQERGFRVKETLENKERTITSALALALAWGFGGSHFEEMQASVSNEIREKFNIQETALIYDMYLNYEEQRLQSWEDKVLKPIFEEETTFYDIVVPTIDTEKVGYLLKHLFRMERHAFLTGVSGTGKTVISQSVFRSNSKDKLYNPVYFTFSAKTSASQVQAKILDPETLYQESITRRSATGDSVNVVIIDDINMPEPELGAQPPIELLRQLVDLKYLYDLEEFNAIDILKTYCFAVASPPGGGRNELTKRFSRHFNVISFPEPSKDTLEDIFTVMLEHFFQDYNKVVKKSGAPQVIKATIELFQKMKEEMLPIPSKFHYTFNLRDASKVIMGLTQSSPDYIDKEISLARLFIHEGCRVFKDRLVDDRDRQWFNEAVIEVAQGCFVNLDNVVLNVKSIFEGVEPLRFSAILKPGVENVYGDLESTDELIRMLDMYQQDYNSEPQHTNKLDLVFFTEAVDHLLRIYRVLNQSRGNAMLVGIGGLGKQSLTKLANNIIDYVYQPLEAPKGDDPEGDFEEWMRKSVLLAVAGPDAGTEGTPMTFMIIDNMIQHSFVLEMINSLLNTGDIPNIFPGEEKNFLCEKMRGALPGADALTAEEVYSAFVKRIRKNLHIVMCMSPIGDALRVNCRQFPALVDCCTIDWFDNWPGEALYRVSKRIIEKDENVDHSDVDKICKVFQQFHLSAIKMADDYFEQTRRKIYITPKTILDLVRQFQELYARQKKSFDDNVETLKKGTVKLAQTNDTVIILKEELKENQPILKESQAIASQKKVEIEKKTKELTLIRKDASAQKVEIEEQKAEAMEQNDQIQSILEGYLPKIEQANKEVSAIDSQKLTTISSKNANGTIRQSVQASCCLYGYDYDGKNHAKSAMQLLSKGTRAFKDSMIAKLQEMTENYKKVLNRDRYSQLKELLDVNNEKSYFFRLENEDTFLDKNPNSEYKKDVVYPICNFVFVIFKLYTVMETVAPLKKKARQCEEKLARVEASFAEITTKLEALKKEAAQLDEDFQEIKAREENLLKSIQTAEIKLERADRLNELLKKEEQSWKVSLERYKIETKTFLGNVLLSSGVINYFGPLNGFFRNQMYDEWHSIVTANQISIVERNKFSLAEIIGDRLEIRDWYNYDLPTDTVSTENGIIAMNGYKWPLMIDPQMQANRWLKKYLNVFDHGEDLGGLLPGGTAALPAGDQAQAEPGQEDEESRSSEYYDDEDRSSMMSDEDDKARKEMEAESLKVIKPGGDYTTLLKVALEKGYPVLMEELGTTIDSVMDPLVMKQFKYSETEEVWTVKFMEEEMEFNHDFRLFFTTKTANPKFLPDIYIKTNVINFTVTIEGLEEQLLGEVVSIVDPATENQKIANVENLSKCKKIQARQEKKILEMLVDEKTQPLGSPMLVDSLEHSREIGLQIEKDLAKAEESNESILKRREEFRPVAKRGALIYFAVDDISRVNAMYQYSLQYIKRLITSAISNMEEDLLQMEVKPMQDLLIEVITMTIFKNVSRGLFEAHKLIFSLMISVAIALQTRKINLEEWGLFLRGAPISSGKTDQLPNPNEDFFTKRGWDLACYLTENHPKFRNLSGDLDTYFEEFFTYSEASEPYDEQIPQNATLAGSKLTNFEKLLLIKVLREDKLYQSCACYVRDEMGENGRYYVDPIPMNMDQIYEESDNCTPIIFILSQGADPKSLLQKLHQRVKKELDVIPEKKELNESNHLQNQKGDLEDDKSRSVAGSDYGDENQPQQDHQQSPSPAMEAGIPAPSSVQDEVYELKMLSISLGDGQGPRAQKGIEIGKSSGYWILLENCHLGRSWMPTLEKIVMEMQISDGEDFIHPNFRLFLTSTPQDYFPVPILQNGIKLTTEPPRGVKANMIRNLNSVDETNFLEALPLRNEMHKMTMGLCFFHAIIQERRKFGPLGWNKFYEFNDSDLDTSKKNLFNFMELTPDKHNIPWESLIYITGTINYGGRVTDDIDKRLLLTIMKRFYTPELLLAKAEFEFSDSPNYYVPRVSCLDDYKTYILSLGNTDDPEAFGMHNNANITFNKQETDKLLTVIGDIQPNDTKKSKDGKKPDEVVLEMVDLYLNSKESVPPPINFKEKSNILKYMLDLSKPKDPLVVVLLQEIDRFNKLLTVCRESLANLKEAIRGTQVMSGELDEVYNSFLNKKVPKIWENVAYPSLKTLPFWVKDLRQRVAFIEDWKLNGYPRHYWLSGLYFPQGFITGLLQTYSRERGIPIDQLRIEYKVSDIPLEQIQEAPDLGGVYISGLFLDGARWDDKRRSLVDQMLGQLNPPLPPISFSPLPMSDSLYDPKEMAVMKTYRKGTTYLCPLYKTTLRKGDLNTTGQSTNYVLSVDLPATSELTPEHLILRGAALVCQLKEQAGCGRIFGKSLQRRRETDSPPSTNPKQIIIFQA